MWTMRCELCGDDKFTTTDDADAIYRHASDAHAVDLVDLRTASRSPIEVGIGRFQYRLPDGRIWMGAVKS